MALPAWCVELALQAIHGAAADRSSDLLVCRYPRLRDGLSFILAIWSAGSAWSDDLHGLDFEGAHAALFYGSNSCSGGFLDYCPASPRGPLPVGLSLHVYRPSHLHPPAPPSFTP